MSNSDRGECVSWETYKQLIKGCFYTTLESENDHGFSNLGKGIDSEDEDEDDNNFLNATYVPQQNEDTTNIESYPNDESGNGVKLIKGINPNAIGGYTTSDYRDKTIANPLYYENLQPMEADGVYIITVGTTSSEESDGTSYVGVPYKEGAYTVYDMIEDFKALYTESKYGPSFLTQKSCSCYIGMIDKESDALTRNDIYNLIVTKSTPDYKYQRYDSNGNSPSAFIETQLPDLMYYKILNVKDDEACTCGKTNITDDLSSGKSFASYDVDTGYAIPNKSRNLSPGTPMANLFHRGMIYSASGEYKTLAELLTAFELQKFEIDTSAATACFEDEYFVAELPDLIDKATITQQEFYFKAYVGKIKPSVAFTFGPQLQDLKYVYRYLASLFYDMNVNINRIFKVLNTLITDTDTSYTTQYRYKVCHTTGITDSVDGFYENPSFKILHDHIFDNGTLDAEDNEYDYNRLLTDNPILYMVKNTEWNEAWDINNISTFPTEISVSSIADCEASLRSVGNATTNIIQTYGETAHVFKTSALDCLVIMQPYLLGLLKDDNLETVVFTSDLFKEFKVYIDAIVNCNGVDITDLLSDDFQYGYNSDNEVINVLASFDDCEYDMYTGTYNCILGSACEWSELTEACDCEFSNGRCQYTGSNVISSNLEYSYRNSDAYYQIRSYAQQQQETDCNSSSTIMNFNNYMSRSNFFNGSVTTSDSNTIISFKPVFDHINGKYNVQDYNYTKTIGDDTAGTCADTCSDCGDCVIDECVISEETISLTSTSYTRTVSEQNDAHVTDCYACYSSEFEEEKYVKIDDTDYTISDAFDYNYDLVQADMNDVTLLTPYTAVENECEFMRINTPNAFILLNSET